MKHSKQFARLRKCIALVVGFCLAGVLMADLSTITVHAQVINEATNNDSAEEAQMVFANYESAAACVNGSYSGQRVINGTISSSDTEAEYIFKSYYIL